MVLSNLEPMDNGDDQDILKTLLEVHASTTSRSIASFILGDLENPLRNFVKGFSEGLDKVLKGRKTIIKALSL